MTAPGYRVGRPSAIGTLIGALVIASLVSCALPLSAQQRVDPRSGRLVLTATDIVLQAGAIKLELQRTLEPQRPDRGVLGTRWRLNWERRLRRSGQLVLLEGPAGPVAFTRSGTGSDYVAATGGRLRVQGDGRAVTTDPEGTTETFDAQGRLVARDDRNGNAVALHYGADGRLARIEGPGRQFLQFTADAAGRVTRVETSTGDIIRYAYVNDDLTEINVNGRPPLRYTYDATGALVRIDDPATGRVDLAFDGRGRVLSRRWADATQERFEYDDAAQRQRHVDPAGAVTTIQWSQDKRKAEITNALGHKSVIESDVAGRPLSLTGPTVATTRLTYDQFGRVVTVENPLRRVTRFAYLGDSRRVKTLSRPDGSQQAFEYDSRENLTGVKVGAQTVAAFTYHPNGSVATVKAVGIPERRLSYDSVGRLTAVANALGQAFQFEYDARNNLIRETNPLGGGTRYQYDPQDRLVSRMDPTGGISRYEYSPQGHLSRIIDPAGGVSRYEYDGRGRLVAKTNQGGQTTRYQYAVSGRLARVIAPDGTTESFQYDALGNQTEWIDRLGRTTAFTYDSLGRLSRERSPTGLEIHYRYDVTGNLIGVEDATGTKFGFQRDSFAQLAALVDPFGAVRRYQYDPLGNLLARTDPRGQATRFSYTPDGAVAGVREATGDEGRYEYDAAGRLVTVRGPSGGVSRFSYDALDNVTMQVDPLGNQRRHTYDAAGRLVSTTDAAGRVTRYLHDGYGRVVEKQLPDGKRVTYQYDRLGNLVSADDGAFPVRQRYDPAGRRVRVEYPAVKKAVSYEYDGAGLRTRLIDPEGRVVRYEYTTDKRLAAVILPDGKRIGLTYDEKDRLQSIRYSNGILGRWEYDAGGRVGRIAYQRQNGQAVAGWTFRYDPAGNPIEEQDHEGHVTRFHYDAAGQLTEAAGARGASRYRHLPGGNRAAIEESGTVISYQHDAGDRLTQAGSEQLAYDANGNLIGRKNPRGTTSYEYDTEGRLVKVSRPDGNTTTFGYSPTGERVSRRDGDGVTYFVYDGLDLIGELNETGVPKAAYVHGPGIDEPLAMLRDGRTYYYHADRLGSIRLVTDDQGQVAAAYDYDAFGKLSIRQASVSNPFTFTGREWDATTGLYYYRARYYDPGIGRFLSKDIVPGRTEDPLTLNPYLYARNNPVRYVDPLGLNVNDDLLELYNLQQLRAALKLQDPSRASLTAQINALQDKIANAVAAGRANAAGTPGWGGEISPQTAQVNGPGGAAYGRPPVYTNTPNQDLPQGLGALVKGDPSNTWETGTGNPTPAGLIDPTPPNTTPTQKIKVPWLGDPPADLRTIPPQGSLPLPEGGPPGPAPAGFRWVRVLQGAALIWTLAQIATSDNPGAATVDASIGLAQAETGAAVGGAIAGPPGALVGGFAGPFLIGTATDVARYAANLPRLFPEPPPPGQQPQQPQPGPGDTAAGPQVGSITGGLPGAPAPGGPQVGSITGGLPGAPAPGGAAGGGYDPRTDPATKPASTTPPVVASAGDPAPLDPRSGGPSGQPPQGGLGGGSVAPQGGYQAPPPQPQSGTPSDPTATGTVPGQLVPTSGQPGTTGPGFGQPGAMGQPGGASQPQGGAGPSGGGLAGGATSSAPPSQGTASPAPAKNPGRATPPPPSSKAPSSPPTAPSGPVASGPKPASAPASGGQDSDLSGTWQANYREPMFGERFAFTLTLSRVATGKWQGPLDYMGVDRPDRSFKAQATLQATGPGKIRLTYSSPKDGPQQADGTYTASQLTFGSPPSNVTYTRK